ncbi:MAG: Asp-tRNA(Asn)/Glu-tRNA(Gln) amidotransferase subunit GatC [Candidatus Paceibacteria bacterium]
MLRCILMEINKEIVRKMGELSRIKLSDIEISQLEKEFGEIFKYFSSISELGRKDEQLFYVTGSKGMLRQDLVKSNSAEEANLIVDNFARKDQRLLVAPKSLD